MSENKQRLVLSIIDFLNQSIEDGTVKSDDKESLEVAIQCIGEAFGVDPADDVQVKRLSVKPTTLPSIFDVFIKTKDKVGASAAAAPAASTSTASATPKTSPATDIAKADELKATGNKLMSEKHYDRAIDAYTQAIALNPTNAVYYSNRAAAYSSKGDHLAAVGDAEQAIATDPTFVKGYHRLGHAQFCLEDYSAAADAFERGLKLEPNNQGLKSSLDNARSRIVASSTSDSTSAPAAGGGGLGDLLSGLGGGGGGGGMPDLASIMNNPQMMAMAQQMMANGGLENMMRNPAIANMMNRVQGGEMPSMSELMNDPTLRNLAQQFGGGMGR
ncbi:Hsc70 cochaperone [Mycena chlorophos]|uniref:Hsc70 cochaperone n=1 Tax=Mycena chlorophos TaxID=658473 RepID=A0A8H6T477_MYCCL|nr:Hsc70 cochaperone [Mycena chlorophos]